MDARVLAALIAAGVALVASVASTILALTQRRDMLNLSQRETLHNYFDQLASEVPRVRAAGMSATTDYLDNKRLRTPARLLVLTSLHYEDDPLIIYRGLDALSDDREDAVNDLLAINRNVWRATLDVFKNAWQDDHGSRTVLVHRLAILRQNQRLLSHFTQGPELYDKDFSDTYYPEFQPTGIVLKHCNFSNCLMDYGYFRDVKFEDCTFTNTILIGSDLEGTEFPNSNLKDAIIADVRWHGTEPADDIPSELENATSFIWESEFDWYGHWTPEASGLNAHWRTKDGGRGASAKIVPVGSHAFLRVEDSNGNNGDYQIERRETLDSVHHVTLVGGTRRVDKGVPTNWLGVYWEQLKSAPGSKT